MFKTKIDLKKLIEPKDIVPILAVIIGIIVAISYNELEIRLIGVCIFILGGVPLFISISSKLPALIEKKYKPQQTPEYSFNIIKQNNATRIVVENSEFTNSPEEDNNPEISSTYKKIVNDNIGIFSSSKLNTQTIEIKNRAKTISEINNLNFNEGDSGVKIIGTFRPSNKSEQNELIEETKVNKNHQDEKELKESTYQETIQDFKEEDKRTIEVKKPIELKIKTQAKIDDQRILKDNVIEEEVISYKEKIIDIPINLLLESEPFIYEEPKKEFEFFLQRILEAIRSVTNTKTAIFFLVNFDKEELILQAYSSNIKEAIIRKRKIPLGQDIVSQILRSSKPEILTEINIDAELDLIPYYTVQTNTQSFIGIPVLFKKAVIGILCADSTLADAYDSITVNFLGQFTKLISSLVHSYTEKYDLLLSAKTLNALNTLRKLAYNRDISIDEFYNAIKDVIKTIFDFQTIGLCCYNNHNGSWYISSYFSSLNDNNYEGLEIEPNESLIGESILSFKTVYTAPIPKDKIRVMKGENIYESGFFVSVPLKSCSYNYGAIYIEGINPLACSTNDIGILETIGEQAGSIIEQLFYADLVNIKDILETQTGILSINAFLNRISQELNRINDYQSNFCLCQIRIDRYAAYYQEMFKEKSELIYHHVINIIKKYLRQYDILGKTDDNTFGIILVGMNLNQSQLWAERLRTEVAKTFLMIKTKRYNATISIGIAEANNTSTLEEILANSTKAIDSAYQKSNKVIIYQ